MIIVQRFGRPQSIRLDQHLPDIVVIWLLWQQISCSGENGKCLLYHEVKNNNVNKKPPKNFKILLYMTIQKIFNNPIHHSRLIFWPFFDLLLIQFTIFPFPL